MGSQQALQFGKSAPHVKGWRTRKRKSAASVEHARILEVARQLRIQCHLPPHEGLESRG